MKHAKWTMVVKLNSTKLAFAGKINYKNKMTGKLREFISSNFTEFNFAINWNRNVQQFNMASLITLRW